MKPTDLIELIDQVDALKPAIDAYSEKIQALGSIAKSLIQPAVIALADMRADAFFHYTSRGLTREEALQMCTADLNQISKIKRK